MAVLENIRKRTTVLILIIGLALFAFVISGVFSSNGFSGDKIGSTVAEINGEEVSIDQFRQQVEQLSRRTGPGASSMQLVNQVWNSEVRNTILSQEFEALGMNVGEDQIVDFIKTNPSYSQNPEWQNADGIFDANIFRAAIADWKVNNPARFQLWLQDEAAIIQMAKEQAYFNLLKSGLGATLKEGELAYKLANDKVTISYARVPYTSIADSAIAVSKSEIASYVKAHAKEYTQENSRDIRFVYFEEKPSLADETAVKDAITALMVDTEEYNAAKDETETINGFATTTDVALFLDRNSDASFDTIYKAKTDMSAVAADAITALNIGETFGPYRDGDTFAVARLMDVKKEGSVKASHILITYTGAERANPAVSRTKEEAAAKAKELLAEAKKSTVIFTDLARENSDGPSASRGGDLGYFQEGVMTDKFNDFAFGNKVGYVGLVETEFGYHIVKVDDKQDVYQVAYLTREVAPSEETSNALFTDATKFEMETAEGDATIFANLAKENSYTVRPVNKVMAMDENLPGLGAQRAVVQWAFNEDTAIGAIKRFNVNNGYAVVQVTAKYAKGVMATEDASASVLPKIRKEKKAAQIIAANKGKSLADFASENNVSATTASALTLQSPTIPGAGREPLVVGTAFGLEEGATSGLLIGESGVFMITVTGKENAPALENYSTYANSIRTANANKVTTQSFNALKDAATINDSRALYY